MIQIAHSIQKLYSERTHFTLVTLIGINGSAPQIEGAKMLVTKQGLHSGTVGGGKIEAHCIQYAKNLLNENKNSHACTWNLQKDIGMSCGGEVTMFFDVNKAAFWDIAIFGAGHISQELCRVLQSWSCQISVFDTRPEWLEKLPTSTNIHKKLSSDLSAEVKSLPKKLFYFA